MHTVYMQAHEDEILIYVATVALQYYFWTVRKASVIILWFITKLIITLLVLIT